MIRLKSVDGQLATPRIEADPEVRFALTCDPILLENRSPIAWPETDPNRLWVALFDARASGHLPTDCMAVRLPDGQPFEI